MCLFHFSLAHCLLSQSLYGCIKRGKRRKERRKVKIKGRKKKGEKGKRERERQKGILKMSSRPSRSRNFMIAAARVRGNSIRGWPRTFANKYFPNPLSL